MTDFITVRYYAGARAAAGTEEEHWPIDGPCPLDTVAQALAERHGPALGRVLDVASFLVDGVSGARDRVVEAGAAVDVLPPFAGG